MIFQIFLPKNPYAAVAEVAKKLVIIFIPEVVDESGLFGAGREGGYRSSGLEIVAV